MNLQIDIFQSFISSRQLSFLMENLHSSKQSIHFSCHYYILCFHIIFLKKEFYKFMSNLQTKFTLQIYLLFIINSFKMFTYILLFFVLAVLITFFLIGLFLIKCLGLVPLAKKIITKVFATQYDKKYSQNSIGPINNDCYVCLQNCKLEVVTDCNHSYCSKCILDYIQIKNTRQVQCPACRKEIYVLLRRFQAQTSAQKQLLVKIAEFNCSSSKQIGFFKAIFEFSNIAKNVGILFSAQGLKFIIDSPRVKYLLILLIYAVSPVDFMPQMLLGPLGLADDTFASLQILRQFSNLWIEFVRQQSNRQRSRVN